MSLSKINLGLLEQKFEALSNTPYFSTDLKKFAQQLQRVAKKTRETAPLPVQESITGQLWQATRYLDGSTSRLLPYEVVYCLERALEDWVADKYLITTAILHEQNFYFSGIPENFYKEAAAFCNEDFTVKLVQIALPDLYRHKPLYNFALYHELGHFVDSRSRVTALALLRATATDIPDLEIKPPGISDAQFEQIRLNHLQEYFCDLFAANYVGSAIKTFLERFAPAASASVSHPATIRRVEVIEAFLSRTNMPVIDLLQNALSALSMPALEVRYDVPNLSTFYDRVHPCPINNVREMHGIFEEGGKYLDQALLRGSDPWRMIPEQEVERIINDLTEKSIRNYVIQKKWTDAAT